MNDLHAMRERLMALILRDAFQYAEEPRFRLVSGGFSRFYFNCKQVTLDPEGAHLIGNLVLAAVGGRDVVAVGGLTLGADPIAVATACASWLAGEPLQAFVVRKDRKDHGTGRRIEGKLSPRDRVVVLDDVITTGGSTIRAVHACREAGLEVVKAVVLVDRQEMNGRENILAEVPEVEALVTRDEIMELYRAKGG